MIETLRREEHKAFPTTAEMRARAFALLSDRTYGETVSYEELAAVMGLDPQHESRARHAVLQAGRDVLRQQHKKIINVATKGYRVVEPKEHSGVSQAQQRAARRRLKAALETVTYVALDKLDAIQVAEVLQEQARAAVLVAMGANIRAVKALPPPSQVHVPTGAQLVDLLSQRKAG